MGKRLSKKKRGNIASGVHALTKVEDVDAEYAQCGIGINAEGFPAVTNSQIGFREKNTDYPHVIQYPYTITQQKDFVWKNKLQKASPFYWFHRVQGRTKYLWFLLFWQLLGCFNLKIGLPLWSWRIYNFWVEKTETVWRIARYEVGQ